MECHFQACRRGTKVGKIIVAGSINMDVVVQTARHPKPGETIFGHDLHYIPGGKGSNQAVAASRLADDVYLIGKLGRDPFGDALTQFLSGENLALDYLSYSDEQPSGIALITVDDASENTIVVVSGSNFQLSAEDVQAVPLAANDVVVSVFEIPQETIKVLFTKARAVGAKTVLNPAPAAAFTDGLLPLVDYLIVNETELAYFAGREVASDDPSELQAQATILRHAPEQHIIITLGSQGVLCVHGDEVIRVAGKQVKAVDTTGAGDCFTGALAVGLSEQMQLDRAIHFANTAASLSVQALGASTSMPKRAAVNAALIP